MSRRKWEQLSTEVVLCTPYYDIRRDRYVLPAGGEGVYTYVDIDGSAMVVPLLDSGELVLVRQHRYLMGRDSLEFPAGGIKRGAGARQTAAQELREEAGYRADGLEPLGAFSPYNGASNEMCQVFLATGLRPAPADPDATEELQPVRLSPDQLRRRVASGEVWDGMTIASLALFELRRP